jgi:predicted Rossmann fold flavoprotein
MKYDYDIIVIGGGAAGFFSAIIACEHKPGLRVALLEQSKEVLNKVRISGGGRCNVTNSIWDAKELSMNYPRGQRELVGPFNKFGCGDTMAWYESKGVVIKIEEDGRAFPESDDSASIVDCLQNAARKHSIKIFTQKKVNKLVPNYTENGFEIHTSSEKISCRYLVICSGSSPSMWQHLESIGYKIVKPVPSLFTFNIKDARIKDLMGLSVPNAYLKIPTLKEEAGGPLLLTHWGLSGPGVLRLSAWAARSLADLGYNFDLVVDWCPELSEEDIKALKTNIGAKAILANAQANIPSRLWKGLLSLCTINEQTKWADINKDTTDQIIKALKQCTFKVNGKSTFKEEFVTAGGVELTHINFTTFESKLHPGLYMAGEVLNIDAITGGFNFQAAWTGGYLIGKNIGEQ